ncbi:hypothetical protein K461DRAFT_274637 [Myriangium duriaei CBS 260.36]|uniref:Secreted protein n=1 Tax=Myriangium duriaei CBS 260.36 TaxID=1168546 RepID=A0A9P4J9I2_9PEZI|nr:hypothetical protein K461DRAFT_274637 [Myriangium duriaei CBS 260.36]
MFLVALWPCLFPCCLVVLILIYSHHDDCSSGIVASNAVVLLRAYTRLEDIPWTSSLSASAARAPLGRSHGRLLHHSLAVSPCLSP